MSINITLQSWIKNLEARAQGCDSDALMESDSLSLSSVKDPFSRTPSAEQEAERSTSSSSLDGHSDDAPSKQKQITKKVNQDINIVAFKNKAMHEGGISEEKPKKVYKFKCKFSGTVCDVLTRKGWVEQEDEYSQDWDIFWCDVNQLRDLFISSNTKILDHQRISHFRSCFEICRKNLLVKNLKRLQSRIRKSFGKEESDKLNFFPTTYILPMDHKFFLQEFRRRPAGYWIIKPAAGAQGRGIVIFSELSEYNSWRKQYHDALKQLQMPSIATATPTPSVSPESVAPYVALSLSATQLRTVGSTYEGNNDEDEEDSNSDTDETDNTGDATEKQLDNKIEDKENAETSSKSLSAEKLFLAKGDGPENDKSFPESTVSGESSANSNQEKNGSEPIETPIKNLRADVFVLQRYIDDPYLIGGRKFDLRLYVLVTSYKPLRAWLYRDGFARFCSESFSMSCMQNMYVHLTNVAVQRTSENYDEATDLKWSLKKFRSFLQARHGRQEVFNFMNQVDIIVVRTLQSILNVVIPDRNSFELYGFDVIIDSNIKPWLLEVNASPAFTPSSEEDYRLKCNLIDDTMNILDLEGRRSGKEKQVGGYDLFWDNGPVYADPNCHYGSSDKKTRKPKLNTFLGCESNRLEKLRQMYNSSHTLQRTRKELERKNVVTLE